MAVRPKMFTPHPSMSADEIRVRTQGVWDDFYGNSASVEAGKMREVAQRAAGIFLDFEAVPADVRQYRHQHRQRPAENINTVGAMAGQAVPPLVFGKADARACISARPGGGTADHRLELWDRAVPCADAAACYHRVVFANAADFRTVPHCPVLPPLSDLARLAALQIQKKRPSEKYFCR